MKIKLNGEDYETRAENIEALIKELELGTTYGAVEVNRAIVRKCDYALHRLSDGDQVEIISFVGGG